MSKVKSQEGQEPTTATEIAFTRGAVKEDAGVTRIGFNISKDNPINYCYIGSVESRDTSPDEEGNERVPALFIHLIHPDDDRMKEDIALWPIRQDYTNFTMQQQQDKQDFIIAHVLGEFTKVPKGLGEGAKSWKEFFDQVAAAFNEGNNGKPVYQDDKGHPYLCRVKLVRSRVGNRVEVPRYGAFFERVIEGKVSVLQVTAYDNFDVTVAPSAAKAKVSGGRGDVAGGIKIPAGFS